MDVLLDFLRSCLLAWEDGEDAHLFIHPPALFHVAVSPSPAWKNRILVRDVAEVIKRRNLRLHCLKALAIDWGIFFRMSILPPNRGFSRVVLQFFPVCRLSFSLCFLAVWFSRLIKKKKCGIFLITQLFCKFY